MLTLTPGASKSWINRFLVLASLARGPSTMEGSSSCDDVLAMKRAIGELGHYVEDVKGGFRVTPGDWSENPHIEAGEAGTVARFLLPLLAWRGRGSLLMSPSLERRPMREGVATVTAAGGLLERVGGAWVVRSPMTSGTYTCQAEETRQFLSGFMMLAAGTGGSVDTKASLEGYTAMTARIITLFGVKLREEALACCGARAPSEASRLLTFEGSLRGASLRAETDLSAASAYLCALAAGGVQGIVRWSQDGSHPEAALPALLSEAGLHLEYHAEDLALTGGSFTSVNMDVKSMPDAVPALAALAVTGSKPSRFHHATYLQSKETDRLAGLIHLLTSAGARAELEGDTLVVHPSVLKESLLMPEEDHRMVMSALILSLAGDNVKVGRTRGLSKSDPGFSNVIEKIRANA